MDAVDVFAGLTLNFEDNRKDYSDETRFITMGHLQGRMMVVVWTIVCQGDFYEESQ